MLDPGLSTILGKNGNRKNSLVTTSPALLYGHSFTRFGRFSQIKVHISLPHACST